MAITNGITLACMMKIFVNCSYGICLQVFCVWCSNNAMDIWNEIKGKETEFKNPQSVGQVLTLT